MTNLLILATGSIAVKKIPGIVSLLTSEIPDAEDIKVKVIATGPARALALEYAESEDDRKFAETWQTEEDIAITDCEHIQLTKWADLCAVLPMSANTLSKVATGCCDNFVLSILRAWPFNSARRLLKPIIAFPAMNTNMWVHPVTDDSIATLKRWGWTIVTPITKKLACGDIGIGALPEVPDVVEELRKAIYDLNNR